MSRPIKAKERETIIQSLKSGVVPRAGLQHIQVGRSEELKSFIKDVDTIAEGGTSFRFVIGEYGSGKTFFLTRFVENYNKRKPEGSFSLQKQILVLCNKRRFHLSPRRRYQGS